MPSARRLQIERLEQRAMMASTQVVGTTMRITGDAANDVFAFVHDSTKPVRVNNVSYAVPANVTRIVFNGGGGQDSITAWINGGAELRPGQAKFLAAGREVAVETVGNIKAYATPGQMVKFFDSTGADTFADRDAYSRMFGPGYDNVAYGFATVVAQSNGQAADIAWFYNLTGAHIYSGRETSARSFNAAHDATAFRFPRVYARGAAGEGDLAEVIGGAGDDQFVGKPGESRLSGAGYLHVATDFDKVVARGGESGRDTADLAGSAGADEFVSWPIFSRLTGAGYSIEAKAFDAVFAQAGEGRDVAVLNDGDASDTLESTPTSTSLLTGAVRNTIAGFELVDVRAGRGGVDRAYLTASGGADVYTGSGRTGQLADPTRTVKLAGLAQVNVVYPAELHPAPSTQSLAYQLSVLARPASDPFALGSGVAFPWKLLADPANPGQIFAITGEGEQGGASYLYRLDSQTLQPIGDPLYVGSSASDIAWVGAHLVVTARNSAEVMLIDPAGWRVLTGALVFQDPIAVTAMGPDRFAVASIRVKELKIYRIENGALAWERTIPLPGIAYSVTFDADNGRLYVNQPSLHKILEIDAATGDVTREHNVGGEPGYGGVIMGRFYVATNRDGFVDFIDRASGAANRIDLRVLLGIDPATAAVRAIDPTDLVVLDDQNLVVVNNRQDSVLLRFNSLSTFQVPTLKARFAGGAFGSGAAPVAGPAFGLSASPAELLITTPSVHEVKRIRLIEVNGQVSVAAQTLTIGVSPIAVARLGSGPAATIAALTSDNALHLISEFTGQSLTLRSIGGIYLTGQLPMASDEQGRLWMIGNKYAGNTLLGKRLIALSAQGVLLQEIPIELTSPYSMTAAHDMVVIVDRTRQQIVTVDVPTASVDVVTLPNERPRQAEIIARGEWLVIHDTNPDMGVTYSRNGVRTFTPYTGAGIRWLSASTIGPDGRPILLDFNGRVMTFDLVQRKFVPWLTLSTEPAMVAKFAYDRLWVVSPADSTVAIIRPGATAPQTVWTDARAFDVIPAEGGAWLVTTAGLVWRSLAGGA